MLLLAGRTASVRPTTLRCSSCGKWKPDEAFHQSKSNPQRRNRHWTCRECRQQRARELARTCEFCGEPTPSYVARLCNACRPEHQQGLAKDRYFDQFGHWGYWTPERIIKAIQNWAQKYGEPPRSNDWKVKARGQRPKLGEKARRTWPAQRNVTHAFGSWNAGIEAAGFTPRPRHLSGGKPNGRTCRSGRHPWVPENITIHRNGTRQCRLCLNESARNRSRLTPRSYALRNTETCRAGLHPWVPSNIHVRPDGKRLCKACRLEAARARKKRAKEKEAA